jgi:acetate kinase
MTKPPVILCLNSGSSSLKFAMFRLVDGETRIAEGAVERIGDDTAKARTGDGGGKFWISSGPNDPAIERTDRFADHEAAVVATMNAIVEAKLPAPDAVGHRIVHGGPRHRRPERIDAALIDSLRRVVRFAPLHLPSEIRAIEAVSGRFADLPQVACFDTAFFGDLPELSRRFPLPRELHDQGLRRYGFHGLSYEYLVEALGANVAGRAILAHLGNGSSMAAIRDGVPIDTTMGLTPTGGIMMGTRSGDLDPGLVLYLLDAGYATRDVERLVNRESGLLGVSGTTSDMKTLLERRAHDERAALAFEMFCYHARKAIGALAAALGGIDSLVFTGGIGQNAPPVRERICAGLEHLGVHVDRSHNLEPRAVISPDGSPCVVRVVPTDEELMIARHTNCLLFSGERP